MVESTFESLTADRLASAKFLDKPALQGVKNIVVEQYSAQAHFIYELLQNADDTGATRADFELLADKLIFRHNGKRHFTISDPKTEEVDSRNGRLGDINAITSIGNGTKQNDAAKIGKFGIGFKAVFQYTETPEIYDKDYSFRIEKFIVPVMLSGKCPYERRADETLFVFPFNKPNVTPVDSFKTISLKLKSLHCPILFLSHMQEINFSFDGVRGFYKKEILETRIADGITEEHILLYENHAANLELLMYSREYEGLRYSVGYFLECGKLNPVEVPAFCFFPTREVTNLKFIIHAPFLLDESRAHLKSGEIHNKILIKLLANLAADSLNFLKLRNLIDDNIIKIIPTDKKIFSDVNSQDQISYLPFYTAIKIAMKTRELIPAGGKCVRKENAYWADFIEFTNIFSAEQLAEIVPNPDAVWAFTSMARDKTANPLREYVDDITASFLTEESLIKGRRKNFEVRSEILGITGKFIENQPLEWLHKFYKWLSQTNNRVEWAKNCPLFLDNHGKATAAFKNSLSNLFLPVDYESNFRTLNPELLKNPETKKFFVDRIGLKEPSLKDEIYNKILPSYDNLNEYSEVDDSRYFRKIFNYYLRLRFDSEKLRKFVEDLKQRLWIRYWLPYDVKAKVNFSKPKYQGRTLYNPYRAKNLVEYFRVANTGRFVKFGYYLKLVGKSKESEVVEFFYQIGVAREAQYFKYLIAEKYVEHFKLPADKTTRPPTWYEYHIEGCLEILNKINKSKTPVRYKKFLSTILWQRIVAVNSNVAKLRDMTTGYYEYFKNKAKTKEFLSLIVRMMRGNSWLVDKSDNFKSANKITVQEMASDYDTDSPSALEIISVLEIKEQTYAHLSEDERRLIEYGEIVKSALAQGRTIDEIKNLLNPQVKPVESKTAKPPRKKRTVSEIQDEISEVAREDEPTQDRDDLTPSPTDYTKKIERLKQKAELEQEQLEQIEELRQTVQDSEKYSYSWFKACLELECLNSHENNLNSKEISISFGRVEKESNTTRTLILKYPSRFIPQFIEDLENIPLHLKTRDSSTKIEIEVVSVKQNTLRVKLKSGAELENINLAEVREATINAQNPIFLLEELRKQFFQLKFEDNFNLRDNLCENIEFIFGPPGTGKTTYLAEKIILPIMLNPTPKKILVLTPTNKAADVLTRKIMNCSNNADWILRFGTTDDEFVEQVAFCEKTFDIRTKPRNVTITTIARFPYDYFLINGEMRHLRDLHWDYIIIDEASMIPLVNIILPLYRKQPEKFFIAGDPHQIEPVIALDLWKNENIYTLVELNSFTEPQTRPRQYQVTKLTTQYRSLPCIGQIFSQLTYGGILQHYRKDSERKNLNLDDWLKIQPLNIIKFPVSEYESIYRAKRVSNSSSYQAYAALFTFEFVKELSRRIAAKNPDKTFTIGIIAPYRVQADLIEKLFATFQSPKNIQISSGTIHGFQGDECDIMVAVFNPPPVISSSNEMFLNRRNIINVSISRARDYLFLIMPDDNTKNIFNLKLIKALEKLFGNVGYSQFNSNKIETLIFDNANYIEENSFSTGHQNVNIYTRPEQIYEIRSDDNAVDIQIHKI